MVEVGILGNDKDMKREAEAALRKLEKRWSFDEAGERVYRGHPAVYNQMAKQTMDVVQASGGRSYEQLTVRGAHWHPDFDLVIAGEGMSPAQQLKEHNRIFAERIVDKLEEYTSQGLPVVWITPVGPMGQYPLIAKEMNKRAKAGRINSDLIFPRAMDEWADSEGNVVTTDPAFAKYMGTFREDMGSQFYARLKGPAVVPEANMGFAANDGLRGYVPGIEALLEEEAGVIFTGGVGMIGHIMFWEPTYGVILPQEIAEKVTYIRGAPLTTETLAQNRFTSAASAPVPAHANTIGLGLFCMLRDYGEANPGKMNAFFGLDNVEKPLIWQRFIAQSMLSMPGTDPSFGASYPASVPGAYIVVANHLEGFNVASK